MALKFLIVYTDSKLLLILIHLFLVLSSIAIFVNGLSYVILALVITMFKLGNIVVPSGIFIVILFSLIEITSALMLSKYTSTFDLSLIKFSPIIWISSFTYA